jgi:hypothetical protein
MSRYGRDGSHLSKKIKYHLRQGWHIYYHACACPMKEAAKANTGQPARALGKRLEPCGQRLRSNQPFSRATPRPQYQHLKAKTSENPSIWLTRPKCGQVASQDSISSTRRATSSFETAAPHSLQMNSVFSPTTCIRQPQQSMPKSECGIRGRKMVSFFCLLAVH